MSFEKIERLLKNHMGLTAESVGASSIERAIKQRMRVLKIEDMTVYHHTLIASLTELHNLIEESVIPETWFFRDQQPFVAVQEYIKEVWTHKGILKVLSLPCSTGEEPYSIAMSLLQAGLHREQFIIDAVDISKINIGKAKKAVYGRNSFRGDKLSFRDQFFIEQAGQYVLKDEVRSCVRFSDGNILDALFMPFESQYHLIFCRNLLIYFDRDTQAQVIRRFHKLLHEGGLLFVGHAEMGTVSNQLFTATKYAKSFAFSKLVGNAVSPARKNSKFQQPDAEVKITSSEDRRKKSYIQPLVERRETKPANVQQAVKFSGMLVEPENLLRRAESLANSGQLTEAAKLCEEYIESANQDANGYFLMGIIREEVGNKETAFEMFKKVTYLDPDHHDALVHLASLSEQKGDEQAAKSFKSRADRVKARSIQGQGR